MAPCRLLNLFLLIIILNTDKMVGKIFENIIRLVRQTTQPYYRKARRITMPDGKYYEKMSAILPVFSIILLYGIISKELALRKF